MEQVLTWIEIATLAWDIRKKRIEYEKQEAELFNKLKTLSDNKPTKMGGFIFNCTTRLGSVDYMSIPIIAEMNLDLYRKAPVVIWKLEKE